MLRCGSFIIMILQLQLSLKLDINIIQEEWILLNMNDPHSWRLFLCPLRIQSGIAADTAANGHEQYT